VESINGDAADLLGSPVLLAEEVTNSDDPPPKPVDGIGYDYTPESYTWTYYTIATAKGTVVVRWYGTSNGYYSETASFMEHTTSPKS
jgi:hypothetical protein